MNISCPVCSDCHVPYSGGPSAAPSCLATSSVWDSWSFSLSWSSFFIGLPGHWSSSHISVKGNSILLITQTQSVGCGFWLISLIPPLIRESHCVYCQYLECGHCLPPLLLPRLPKPLSPLTWMTVVISLLVSQLLPLPPSSLFSIRSRRDPSKVVGRSPPILLKTRKRLQQKLKSLAYKTPTIWPNFLSWLLFWFALPLSNPLQPHQPQFSPLLGHLTLPPSWNIFLLTSA